MVAAVEETAINPINQCKRATVLSRPREAHDVRKPVTGGFDIIREGYSIGSDT